MDRHESGLRIIGVLVSIAFLAALMLAFVNQVTREPIEKNIREETRRAVGEVLQSLGEVHYPMEAKIASLEGMQVPFFPAFGADSLLKGYAFLVKAPGGFGGDFDLVVGIDMNGKVLDIYVLSHKETPGLGDRMQNEEFRSQFRGRTLQNTRWAVKKDGGDIDALTAATITSRAFTAGVKRALLTFGSLQKEVGQ